MTRTHHRRERETLAATDLALLRRKRSMSVPECRALAERILGRPVPTLGTLTYPELRLVLHALDEAAQH